MIIFETDRLRVLSYTEQDEENFFNLNGNEDVMRYIRPVKNRKESNEFLREVIATEKDQPGLGRWAVEEQKSGAFIGSFALIPLENSGKLQLGYALLPPFWGKGYATELCHTGIRYFFQTQKDPVLYAYTEQENEASQKVLLKTGFRKLGIYVEKGKELFEFGITREEALSEPTRHKEGQKQK